MYVSFVCYVTVHVVYILLNVTVLSNLIVLLRLRLVCVRRCGNDVTVHVVYIFLYVTVLSNRNVLLRLHLVCVRRCGNDVMIHFRVSCFVCNVCKVSLVVKH